MLKHLLSNQSGFFAMLLVAITSFALWSTMSTMHTYSTNKSDTLAKIKETVDMNAVMSDFAIEAQAAFYRHYIAKKTTGSDCPSNPDLNQERCSLTNEGNLCLNRADCSTCLEVVYGKDSSGNKVSEDYCATFSDFSSDDAFGKCSDDNILCVTVAIDANDKENPPTTADLADCKSCFVQPLKIYLDISSAFTTTISTTTQTTQPPNCVPPNTCEQKRGGSNCLTCSGIGTCGEPRDACLGSTPFCDTVNDRCVQCINGATQPISGYLPNCNHPFNRGGTTRPCPECRNGICESATCESKRGGDSCKKCRGVLGCGEPQTKTCPEIDSSYLDSCPSGSTCSTVSTCGKTCYHSPQTPCSNNACSDNNPSDCSKCGATCTTDSNGCKTCSGGTTCSGTCQNCVSGSCVDTTCSANSCQTCDNTCGSPQSKTCSDFNLSNSRTGFVNAETVRPGCGLTCYREKVVQCWCTDSGCCVDDNAHCPGANQPKYQQSQCYLRECTPLDCNSF